MRDVTLCACVDGQTRRTVGVQQNGSTPEAVNLTLEILTHEIPSGYLF